MKRITLFFIIIFIGFQTNLKAQEQETILDILNKSNENSTYLKDFKFELGPGEIAKYSILLNKDVKYEFLIFQDNQQLDFELYEDKTEGNLLQKKDKLSEKIIKADYKTIKTGIYHIFITNKSDKIAKSVLLLSKYECTNVSDNNKESSKNVSSNSEEKRTESGTLEKEEIYLKAEQMPLFGNAKDHNESVKLFQEFIKENIIYPEEAKTKKIKGRVYITFVLNKEGYIKYAKVVRGVHSSLDQEALRVIFTSPRWQPAKEKGIPVNISFTFPIIFELD